MPKYTIPEIPAAINVSQWDKKREILSKTKPSGVTAAIKALLDIYKKTDWTPIEKLPSEVKLDGKIGNYAVCAEFGKTAKAKKQEIQNLKKNLETAFAALRKASLSLHKTAKDASAMFASAKSKYPKAAKAAAEIAAEALTFAGYTNPASLNAYVDQCFQDELDSVSAHMRATLAAFDIPKAVAKSRGNLNSVKKQSTPELRATALKDLTPDDYVRSVTTALGLRVKAALMGFAYPAAAAKSVLDALDPYANQKIPITPESVDEVIATIETHFVKAASLPNTIPDLKI